MSEGESAGDTRDDVVSKHRHQDDARGEKYLDERNPLAYVYDGDELVAILHKREVVEEFEDDEAGRWYTVSRTPRGEEVLSS